MASNVVLGQVADLAVDVVDHARISLMGVLRFMDVALWRMPLASRHLSKPLGTDGYLMYVDTVSVVSSYLSGENEVLRDYLHAILHCVFGHPFDDKHDVRALWDLACDIAVESCAIEVVGLRFPSKGDEQRRRALETLHRACPDMTAPLLYNAFVQALDDDSGSNQVRMPARTVLSQRFIESLPALFARDDHSVWTRERERPVAQLTYDDDVELLGITDEHLRGRREEDLTADDADNAPAVNMAGAPAPSMGGAAAEGQVEGGDRLLDIETYEKGEASFANMLDVAQADFDDITWTDISALVDLELEAFIGKAGVDAGTFEVNLKVSNRKAYDYRDFLKRFSALSEEMKVSTEEFDYVYYTYGLNLYRNMPLVEPLEYQESRRVREFVIAIDTSASCAGGLVKHFVEKTYDVLKSTAAFGRKVNVHIVQCDCEVRKDVKITETSHIDDDFGDFEARGFGGTDFRPVFAYVDELIASREFTNLKGMIYLTDGIGTYPEEPPDYLCAFVFVDESYANHVVPPWAMKVLMTEDEVLEL